MDWEFLWSGDVHSGIPLVDNLLGVEINDVPNDDIG